MPHRLSRARTQQSGVAALREWAAERALAIEPYGVDIAPRRVEFARHRPRHWAGRVTVGNAIGYEPADGAASCSCMCC
jgi:hypothetical protein